MSKELVESNFIIYKTEDGSVIVDVILKDETIWITQKGMSELFDVNVPAISKHLDNIYQEQELYKESTVSKMETVRLEGSRKVKRILEFYNLDAIIAVGYRVNSKKATQFRIWATNVLKEYMIKGFVIDKEKMKNGPKFGKDYFDELLEIIKEIRLSEIDNIKKSQIFLNQQALITMLIQKKHIHSLKLFKTNYIMPLLVKLLQS